MKNPLNSVEERKLGQGVISEITFPTDKDEVAVSKAINSLLSEGWIFMGITDQKITLRRIWEA